MASEYLLKKAKESYVPEEVRELTPAEKRRNWWHYNKWFVVVGAVLVVCLAVFVANILGVGKVNPDVSMAYVGSEPLDQEAAAALKDAVTALCPDLNGDGQVLVQLRQYVLPDSDDPAVMAYTQAAQMQLIGDISTSISYFFLMEDPDMVEVFTSALRNLDGTLSDRDETSAEGKYLPLGSIPAFAALNLSKKVNGLGFARRGFWNDNTVPNVEGCDTLWDALTEGVLPQ